MRKGYLTAPVIIILALITLAVAFVIYFNTNLIKQSKNQPEPTANQTPSDVVDQQADETASWKTYLNQETGLSVKYPPNWSHAVSSKGQIFFQPIGEEPSGDVFTTVLTAEQAVRQPLIQGDQRNTLINKRSIKVAGVEGEQADFGDSGKEEIVFIQTAFARSDKAYYFNLHDLEHKTVYDQILSTFKFVE